MWGGGRVVECRTFRSRGPGFKSPPSFRSLGNFVYPTLPVSFGRDSKAVGPFYLVSMPGEIKDPTQGAGKYLLWTPLRFLRRKTLNINHSYVSSRHGCLELNVIRVTLEIIAMKTETIERTLGHLFLRVSRTGKCLRCV